MVCNISGEFVSQKNITVGLNNPFYYDLRLGLDYNLDKDLSKNERNDQLVKCKDTE